MKWWEWIICAYGTLVMFRWLLSKVRSIGFLSRQRTNRRAAFKSSPWR